MIDHITLGVSDLSRSNAFYEAAFAPLGLKRLMDIPKRTAEGCDVTGFGDTRPFFWLAEQRPTQGMLHIALQAKSQEEVQAFHNAALGAGGRDNGQPGPRPHYGPDYYGAFVLDPDGQNIEAVFRDF